MPPEKRSPLESLEDRLYRNQTPQEVSVPAYSNQETPEAYGWTPPPPPPPVLIKKRMPWTVKFLIGTGVFLVLAGGAAAFLVFHGTRSFSSDQVVIQAQSNTAIASGDTVSIVITVHNGNPTAMNNATLLASLPPGTRAGDGTDAPLTQYTDVLGTVPPGGDVTRTIQAKLFGTEGQSLTIPIKVSYSADGSNASFESKKDYSITVSTSPISVQVQTLSQTPSGQPLTLTVVVRSNASADVQNVALSAVYPAGFSLSKTDPAASGTNFFNLGTLVPGDQKIIKITGTLTGQSTDLRVFRFTAGSANPDGTSSLGNSFAEGDATIAITNPFLNVGLSLNRESADSVLASPGDVIGAMLTWQNTLAGTLANASIKVALSGNALDTKTISGGTGFYRSSDGSVIFDSSNNTSLASLSSGDTGAGSFTFGIKSPAALNGIKNPIVTLTVSVTGQQASQGGAAQTLSSTLTRTVKIGSAVTISSVLSHTNATASGPVPPVAGKETLYTVTLSAKNTLNSVGAAKETFQLPSYVRYTGVADAGVLYNPDTRTVTWTIGDLVPGGNSTGHFQIGFTPSTSQTGGVPVLVQDQSFTGVDRFTGQQVYSSAAALTTQLQGSIPSGTVH
ncbi:MAG: hypothetical protein JWL75_122 [Parcubacteria group bacterium]|nr:hypothetical protein [Parcubacteria group bacterium]